MKNPIPQRILWFFAMVSCVELLLLLLPLENHSIRYLTKPLLIPTLIFYDYLNRNSSSIGSSTYRIALAFAWLGDVLLMIPSAFLFGLLSFLIMQLLYTRIFWKDCPRPTKGFVFQKPWIVMLLLGVHLSVMFSVWGHLGAMQIPVAVYSIVILGMVLTAINRVGTVADATQVAIGAVLFMISDGLIAITKFGSSFSYSSFCVMLTYILAQFLILNGRQALKE